MEILRLTSKILLFAKCTLGNKVACSNAFTKIKIEKYSEKPKETSNLIKWNIYLFKFISRCHEWSIVLCE